MTLLTVPALLLATVPLAAQSGKGWMVRADRSTNATDPDGTGDIKFMAMGSSFHAIYPTAAVFWNPANTASGNFTLRGSFKLLKPSGHTNYYGLVLGGSELATCAARAEDSAVRSARPDARVRACANLRRANDGGGRPAAEPLHAPGVG